MRDRLGRGEAQAAAVPERLRLAGRLELAAPGEVVDAIFAAVQDFRGDTPPNDDMTAVALKITT